MPDYDVRILGKEKVLAKIAHKKMQITSGIHLGVVKATRSLKQGVVANASRTDYSLNELEDMGYPYARRDPHPPLEPPWLVHTRSGKLVSAIMSFTHKESWGSLGRVYIDATIAPHAPAVLFGTTRMIGRDFLRETRIIMSAQIRKTIVDTLRLEVRGG